jgi:hypothetical protein
MASTYTIYATYALVPTGNTAAGYRRAIHCNYINSTQLITTNINVEELRINFVNNSDFKFLSSATGYTAITLATGYTVNRIYVIFQRIFNQPGQPIPKPVSTDWKYLDVTDQIIGHHNPLTAKDLTSIVFKIPFINYTHYLTYDLDYLNYPSASQTGQLCFGDEEYFFGNVTTEIKADVYTTDMSINVNLNEFNSSTNLSWEGGFSKVYISEVALFDSNKNLVAIGKLNDPVPKDETISRTLLFAIDF